MSASVRAEPTAGPRSAERAAPSSGRIEVRVAGFWCRAVAASIDLVVLGPAGIVAIWLASAMTGVKIRFVDLLLDLLLAVNPAALMAAGLMSAVAALYLLVMQISHGRTIGMKVLGLRIIDVYGAPPSPLQCVLRTAGYFLGIATFLLGFFWIGFDREKRGWHDWLASTYVIYN